MADWRERVPTPKDVHQMVNDVSLPGPGGDSALSGRNPDDPQRLDSVLDDSHPRTSNPWTFDGESSPIGPHDTVTLVNGTSFLISDRSGDLPGHGARGLFMLDTRVLSRWEFTVNGVAIEPLAVVPSGPFSASFVGRIGDPTLADAPLTIVQRRHLGQGLREDMEIRNHGAESLSLRVCLRVGSDFGNLFDVKSGVESGFQALVCHLDRDNIKLNAPTARLPNSVTSTCISATRQPNRLEHDNLIWDIELDPGEIWSNCLLVSVEIDAVMLEPSYQCGTPVDTSIPHRRLREWSDRISELRTDFPSLDQAVRRSSEDLGALRIFDPTHPDRLVVAAGAPWYMTLFGRDSILTSWMALVLDHNLAEGVLMELADAQGTEVRPESEEQPGRILHEVRFDIGSARVLGGSNTYYGTIDATPLFVMLVAELARWTGVTPTIRRLMPAVERAMRWIEDYGDPNGDGFLEYSPSTSGGLTNQGWKDSWDGVRYADGSVAHGSIALAEVQGYFYAALVGHASLIRATGGPEEQAQRLESSAEQLKKRFHERYWMTDVGWYAIGLDQNGQLIDSLTSNIGHLLWTGIVPEAAASALATVLTSDDMFSGWGLRTLSSRNPAYNPISYHCGSVWPHDTAIACAGLFRYGLHEAGNQIGMGLLRASRASGSRLPELFAGFSTSDVEAPVPYPASCSPQAWAAASPLLLVRSMLGLEPDLPNGIVRLRPRLPRGLSHLRFSDIPLGGRRATVIVTDAGTTVTDLPRDIVVELDEGDSTH